MNRAVTTLPTPLAIDMAWTRYADLVHAASQNPALAADRAHCEALALAWAEWRDLFLAWRPK